MTFLKELMLTKQVQQKSDVFHYCYFLNDSFKFQRVCSRCHDLLMLSMSLSNIFILNIKDSDYCGIFSLICKNQAISIMQNADLTEKSGTL